MNKNKKKTVSQLRLYNCTKCKKAFFSQRKLDLHQKSHERILNKNCFVKLVREEFSKCHKCLCYFPRNSEFEKKHELSHIKTEPSENNNNLNEDITTNTATEPVSNGYLGLRNRLYFEDDIKDIIVDQKPLALNEIDRNRNPPEETNSNKAKDPYKEKESNCKPRGTSKKSKSVTLTDTSGKNVIVKRNENKRYVCPVCDKKFMVEHAILEHYHYAHSGVKAFRCELCLKDFATFFFLKMHMNTHEQLLNFICDYCNKSFKTKHSLKTHIRIHTGIKPFVCNFCDKRFTQQNTLQRHKKIHTGVKDFPCDFCDKKFACKGSKVNHERIHMGLKPFQCSHCGRAFSDHSACKRHEDLHTKKRRFECDLCQKSYTTKAGLYKHQIVHKGEKTFRCEQCPYKAYARGTVKVHVNMVHKRIKHECMICYKQFATAYNLKAHIYSYHCDIQQHECDYCGKKFSKKSSIRQHVMGVHLRTDVFDCRKCNKKYYTQTGYTRHVNTVHKKLKNFECDYCGSKYTLKSTIIEHILNKHCTLKYCYKCMTRFSDPIKLKVHVSKCTLKNKGNV